jgi:hypothetical protein
LERASIDGDGGEFVETGSGATFDGAVLEGTGAGDGVVSGVAGLWFDFDLDADFFDVDE